LGFLVLAMKRLETRFDLIRDLDSPIRVWCEAITRRNFRTSDQSFEWTRRHKKQSKALGLFLPLTDSRVDRLFLFPPSTSSIPTDPEALACLQKLFHYDLESPLPEQSPRISTPITNEFNLFSTTSGPTQVSLTKTYISIPNQKRPREYYFTDPYGCVLPF
jgi:hypothetical protein